MAAVAELGSLGLMKLHVILLALVFVLAGCVPLRQEARVSGPAHPDLLLCDDRYVLVGIDMNYVKIVTAQSYITAPNGKRYSIQALPHQFDIDQKFEGVRADVYPCDSNGSRLRHWSNGVWSFHFVFETNGVSQTIDQQWKYWTFHYNPAIHGPPN